MLLFINDKSRKGKGRPNHSIKIGFPHIEHPILEEDQVELDRRMFLRMGWREEMCPSWHSLGYGFAVKYSTGLAEFFYALVSFGMCSKSDA